MECDICGEREARYLVKIEGAKLNLCHVCARGGEIISSLDKRAWKQTGQFKTEKSRLKIEKEVVYDYAERIQKGLKNMGIEVNVLSEKLNIKYSQLNHIAQGKIYPDLELAVKLEKELNIELIENVVIGNEHQTDKEDKGVTLGDIIEIK